MKLKNLRSYLAGGRVPILASGLILTLALCTASLVRPAFLAHLDGRFFDGLISGTLPPAGNASPVVVAVDDESLARFGRWPWPRALTAELLDRIAAQQPASVAIDILFAEPESRGLAAAPTPAENHGTGNPDPLSAGDAALARALAGGPFVLGFELTFAPGADPAQAGKRLLHPLEMVSVSPKGLTDPRQRLWQATGAVLSRREFSGSVAAEGFVNAAMEQDGILRRMPVLIRQGDGVFPSLALAAALRSLGPSEAVLASNWYGDRYLEIGARRIPLDDRGRLLLRYRGWHGAEQPLSAAALLEGRVPPDALRGRVVFVGATATGMGEAVSTPVNSLLSGVQVHAIAAENILAGDFARVSAWPYRLLATASMGLLATLVCLAVPVIPGAVALGVTAMAAWQASVWLFQASGVLLSPVVPVLALLGNFSLLSLVRTFFVEKRNRRQTRDLAATRDFIMTSLAALTEIRDTETGGHIRRTQRYLHILCRELSRYPRFQSQLDHDTIELITKLAPLHDIGKVGLSDHLLHKTTPFTAQEYEEVKKHAAYGRDTIARAEARAGMHDDQLLRYAKELAYCHHERWDGSGYPEGLQGEQIPWPGRIMALADSYDAMISRRVYKEPIPHKTAVALIVQGRGTLFDPDVVDAFIRVEAQWWQIASQLADADEVAGA